MRYLLALVTLIVGIGFGFFLGNDPTSHDWTERAEPYRLTPTQIEAIEDGERVTSQDGSVHWIENGFYCVTTEHHAGSDTVCTETAS